MKITKPKEQTGPNKQTNQQAKEWADDEWANNSKKGTKHHKTKGNRKWNKYRVHKQTRKQANEQIRASTQWQGKRSFPFLPLQTKNRDFAYAATKPTPQSFKVQQKKKNNFPPTHLPTHPAPPTYRAPDGFASWAFGPGWSWPHPWTWPAPGSVGSPGRTLPPANEGHPIFLSLKRCDAEHSGKQHGELPRASELGILFWDDKNPSSETLFETFEGSFPWRIFFQKLLVWNFYLEPFIWNLSGDLTRETFNWILREEPSVVCFKDFQRRTSTQKFTWSDALRDGISCLRRASLRLTCTSKSGPWAK